MSEARKRGSYNERVALAHERKQWVEENRRIERMEREAAMLPEQKRKRQEVRKLLAITAGLMVAGVSRPFSFSV